MTNLPIRTKLISFKDTAEILGVSTRMVYKLAQNGDVKVQKVGGHYRCNLNQNYFRVRGLTYESVFGSGVENDYN